MVVSENVRVTGVVNFKRLFRIDGNANATFMAPKEVFFYLNIVIMLII